MIGVSNRASPCLLANTRCLKIGLFVFMRCGITRQYPLPQTTALLKRYLYQKNNQNVYKRHSFESFYNILGIRLTAPRITASRNCVCVGWSEIDKYAIKAHNALFPEYADRNYGDITKIDWSEVPDFDFLTYSSPCQDFSSAGQQKGGEEGRGTRSSLLWEVKKAIIAKKPPFLLMENVKNLVSKKFILTFRKWLDWLTEQGYTNHVAVLNANDYGVAQHRERVFVVSMLDDRWFRFPEPRPLTKSVEDYLEDEVDEKYYKSQEVVDAFIAQLSDEDKQRLDEIYVEESKA